MCDDDNNNDLASLYELMGEHARIQREIVAVHNGRYITYSFCTAVLHEIIIGMKLKCCLLPTS
jgi:hypothetical protein